MEVQLFMEYEVLEADKYYLLSLVGQSVKQSV